MEIDLTTHIVQFKSNKPIKNEDGTNLTLQDVCCNALLNGDWRELTGKQKQKRYDLAQKLVSVEKIELGAPDIVLLKKLISEMYAPLIVGQVLPLLDPFGSESEE